MDVVVGGVYGRRKVKRVSELGILKGIYVEEVKKVESFNGPLKTGSRSRVPKNNVWLMTRDPIYL